MNKALWAVPAVALLGAVSAVAVIVASPGGEEEVVQQPASATPMPGSPTPTWPATSATPVASTTPVPSATAGVSPTPLPDGWQVYGDSERGFSFPHPPGLTLTEQIFDELDKAGKPTGQVRTLSLRHPGGTPAISMAIAPNPGNLSLEDWIRTFPGWPTEPRPVTIGGESGLLFEINQMGQRYPGAYFRHADSVFSISANVFGAAELGVSAAPGISETDFQRVMDGFRFGP